MTATPRRTRVRRGNDGQRPPTKETEHERNERLVRGETAMTAGLWFTCFAVVAAIGLILIGQFAPPHEPDPPKPIARPGRVPLGEDIAGAIGGAFMLAVALVGLLVWLSPALILGWLVTR